MKSEETGSSDCARVGPSFCCRATLYGEISTFTLHGQGMCKSLTTGLTNAHILKFLAALKAIFKQDN